MGALPPKPLLSLTVGIVGHRLNRLPLEARVRVAAQVNELLGLIAKTARDAWERHGQVFTKEPPALRLISALAEGADRIGASGALEHGYSLTAILPFGVEEYARDFKQQSSKKEYERLLDKAETTLVLPGCRAQEAVAYETAGLTLVDNSDLLLAVWDGGAPAGWGGTIAFIERAARNDLPIIHVDAKGEQEPRILWSGLARFRASGAGIFELPASDLTSALPTVVDEFVRPPKDETENLKLSRYFGETWKPRNWRLELPLLLAFLGLRPLRKTDFRSKEPTALAIDFESHASCRVQERLRQRPSDALSRVALAYGWADALGIRYAQVFRGAYTSNFICAALAVLAGVTSLVGTQLFGWPSWPLAVVEAALLGFIFINTYVGRKADWHSRWRESRAVAERLRAAELLWLVALPLTLSRASEVTWTAWYVLAQMRGLGLAAGALDKARLDAIRRSLITVVEAQRTYHAHNASVMRGVERRIEGLGYVLIGLAILLAAVNIIVALSGQNMPVKLDYLLVGLIAALPALGAATFGIRLIGDFEGVADSSDRTNAILSDLGEALRHDQPDLAVLRSRARSIADVMLGDVSHWLITTETRRLVEPA